MPRPRLLPNQQTIDQREEQRQEQSDQERHPEWYTEDGVRVTELIASAARGRLRGDLTWYHRDVISDMKEYIDNSGVTSRNPADLPLVTHSL